MGGLPTKPKLQGYVAQELFDEFERSRTTHNLNQSKGLEKLLAEFFNGSSASTLPPHDVVSALPLIAALRSELVELKLELTQRLQLLENRLADSSADSSATALDGLAKGSATELAVSMTELADSSADESASEPLVDEPAASEPPEEEAVVVEEPAAGEQEEIAPTESPQLTREQLGKRFKVSRETIRQWEKTSNLAEKGWEVVPGTGSSPKNPRLYRPAAHANQPPQLR